MNKCKASAFKNLDLKKSNFLEKKMYPILDTRVECKETKEDKVEPVTEKIRIEPDCNFIW